jgi:RNA polymerase sigma-70 factor (ECF subfamily)
MGNDAVSLPEQLLMLIRGGEEAALGQLLELFRSYVRLLAQLQIDRGLRGKLDASDIVQETFLQAQQSFTQFRGRTEGELMTWLRTILASKLERVSRQYYGTQQRDLRLERRLQEELDQSSCLLDGGLVSRGSTPSQKAIRREQAVLLADALARLGPEHRQVIILKHLEGRSFPEVSQQMGRTVDSVKGLWARAMGQLRGELGDSP